MYQQFSIFHAIILSANSNINEKLNLFNVFGGTICKRAFEIICAAYKSCCVQTVNKQKYIEESCQIVLSASSSRSSPICDPVLQGLRERNRVANPTHSLYVIKPRTRVAARRAGGWHAWNSRTSRRILPPAATVCVAFLREKQRGLVRWVMLRRGNPRGRAVTSNHPPEI